MLLLRSSAVLVDEVVRAYEEQVAVSEGQLRPDDDGEAGARARRALSDDPGTGGVGSGCDWPTRGAEGAIFHGARQCASTRACCRRPTLVVVHWLGEMFGSDPPAGRDADPAPGDYRCRRDLTGDDGRRGRRHPMRATKVEAVKVSLVHKVGRIAMRRRLRCEHAQGHCGNPSNDPGADCGCTEGRNDAFRGIFVVRSDRWREQSTERCSAL